MKLRELNVELVQANAIVLRYRKMMNTKHWLKRYLKIIVNLINGFLKIMYLQKLQMQKLVISQLIIKVH